MVGGDRIVFVNYPVGSFGSFLTTCLRQTPNAGNKLTNTDVFDQFGSAHRQIEEWLDPFHSPPILTSWLQLPDNIKQQSIINSWKPPKSFVESDLFYVHRLTVPYATDTFMKFFPEAKFIKIIVNDSEIDDVAEMFYRKIMNNNPQVHIQLPNGISAKQFSYDSVCEHRNNEIIHGVYNFNVKWFLDGSFVEEFDRLCEWLGFEKIDLTDFYERFKQVNGIKI